MKRYVMTAIMLAIVAALIGAPLARAGMMGAGATQGQTPAEQSPQPKGEHPPEQSGQMPMSPEMAARMMNACMGAMEGMAQMGRMMGGMGGQRETPEKPSEQRP